MDLFTTPSPSERLELKYKQLLEKWIEEGAKGVVQIPEEFKEGFVKKAIHRALATRANRSVQIVTKDLCKWDKLVKEEGWTTVQALSKPKSPCDFAIFIEGETSSPFLFSLSFGASENGMSEEELRWYIAPYKLYAYSLTLSPKEEEAYLGMSEEFFKAFSHFDHSLTTLSEVSKSPQLRRDYELSMGYESGVCSNLVTKAFKTMRDRANFLKYHTKKEEYVTSIVHRLKSTLIVSDSVAVVERLKTKGFTVCYKGMPSQYYEHGRLTKYTKNGLALAKARGKVLTVRSGARVIKEYIHALNEGSLEVLVSVGYVETNAKLVVFLSPSLITEEILNKLGNVKVVVLHMRACSFTTVETKQVRSLKNVTYIDAS